MENKYANRLYKEWCQHGRPVIAVDYDSTIYPWHTIENKEDIERTIKLLQLAVNIGCYIVINTCSDTERHLEIQKHCESLNIPINGINTNPIDLPYGNHGKIYANLYLDDRAGLNEALDILEKVIYQIMYDRNGKTQTLGEHC